MAIGLEHMTKEELLRTYIGNMDEITDNVASLVRKNSELEQKIRDLNKRINTLNAMAHSMGSCGHSRVCD